MLIRSSGIDAIDRSRKQFTKRIKMLNSKRCKTLTEFQSVVEETVKLMIEGEALSIVRSIVIQAYGRIVERTPVDTGRARASWQFSTGHIDTSVQPEGEYKDKLEAIKAEIEARIARAEPGIWYISNHLEYIEALEAGWSRQAPGGMVALTLQELKHRLSALNAERL